MFSGTLATTTALMTLQFSTVFAAPPPNFVFILADDQGQYSVGYNNPLIHSPAIDNLAATGVLLKEFYVYQYCSPTRQVTKLTRHPW